ncbi:unnamed protein product [Cyclocybe aegerita]|uniref:Extracellular conserved serine-rich protein n=1 Tax=Cyclocybe aegerita TaxID=1973307 RepID=A0A8S0W093_CYCAE|nr:unnamed protein product [Cyclocybe aegerita]
MFSKLIPFALLAQLASALVLQIPENPTSGGSVTIRWTNEASDTFDTFSLELINTAFNNAFAIANNVNPSAGQITLTLPIVPVGSGYTLEAVNIGNINDVFASTGSFSIGASTASVTSTSTSASGSTSGTVSGSGSSTVATSRTTQSGLSTNIVTTTGTSSTDSLAATTSDTASATPSTFGSGAMGLNVPLGSLAAIVVSGLAGAAMIAL